MSKSRNFTFTWNNYSKEDITYLKDVKCKYLLAGKEVGESGTPHLQGLICFENPRSFESVRKNIFLGQCHVEVCKSINASIKYCKKDNDFFETGEAPSGQGFRTDLLEVKKKIDEGVPMKEIWDDDFCNMLQWGRGLTEYKNQKIAHRTKAPEVVWLWGTTGTGKTEYSFLKHGQENVYVKDGTKWWNGYEQHTAICIDDFDGNWPFRDLLRLLDKYPYQGECKGGYVKITSDYIYITCEYEPAHFWKGNELDQVMRRITKVIHRLKGYFEYDNELLFQKSGTEQK